MPARHLRDLVKWAEEDLEAAFGELDVATRSGRVAEVPGLRVPAEDLPWLRIRELVIHVTDLEPAADLGRLPDDLVNRFAIDLLGSPRAGVQDAIRWVGEQEPVQDAHGEAAYSTCLAVIAPASS